MKIVHRTRDCVGIIAGVEHIDGPLQVKYWGVRTPVTPAALTPMISIPVGLYIVLHETVTDRLRCAVVCCAVS